MNMCSKEIGLCARDVITILSPTIDRISCSFYCFWLGGLVRPINEHEYLHFDDE